VILSCIAFPLVAFTNKGMESLYIVQDSLGVPREAAAREKEESVSDDCEMEDQAAAYPVLCDRSLC